MDDQNLKPNLFEPKENLDKGIKSEGQLSLDYFINENKLLRDQIVFYQQELSNAKGGVFNLERRCQILNEEKGILNDKIKQYEESNQKSIESNAKLKEETYSLIHQLDDQKNEVLKIKIAQESNGKIISDYKNQIVSLNQYLSEKSKTISQHMITIGQLTTTKSELEQKIVQLNMEISNKNLKQLQTEQKLQSQLNLSIQNEEMTKIDKDNIQQKQSLLNDSFSRLQTEFNASKQRNEALIHELNKQIKLLKESNLFKDSQINQSEIGHKAKQFKIEELIQSLNQMNKAQYQMKNEANLLKEMVNDKENEIKRLYEYKRKLESIEFYEKSSLKSSHLNSSINDIDFIKEDYQKLKAINNQIKYERDNLLSNIKLLNIKLKDYQDIKEQFEENNAKLNEYTTLKRDYETILTEHKTFKEENQQYKERLEIISQQNRRLLLKNELDFGRNNPNYLSQSLKNGEYEQFLYNNIEDLESKINQVIQSNLQYQKEIDEFKSESNKNLKELNVSNQLIKSMEEYLQGLEIVNSSQRKENNKMKRSITSSFFIWNDSKINADEDIKRKYSTNEESFELKLQELTVQYNELIEKEKLSQSEIVLMKKQLDTEAKKIERNLSDILKLNESIHEYQNQLSEKRKELSMIQIQNTNMTNQLNEKVSNLKVYENKLSEMNQMIIMLQNDKSRLIKTIDVMLKSNEQKVDETKIFLEKNMKDILEENKQMKTIIDFIQSNVKEIITSHSKGEIPPQKEDEKLKIIEIKEVDSKDLITQKQKEFIELKHQISQMKITIENISTENSMLKYKESLYHGRLSPLIQSNFQQNIQIKPKETTEQFNPLNNTSLIEESYLKVVNENKELSDNLLIMKSKVNELTSINNQLISGDITAPYKALSNQIDEMTKTIANLKITNENLIKEKESIIKNYSFLNLTNESIKEKQSQIEVINSSLVKETQSLSDIIKRSSNEIELLKQKDNIIQEKDKENYALQLKIDDLYININKLESERSDLNIHEKNLKEEIELKKKEFFESKSRSFKNFYVSFKKSKNIISFLQKINSDLEEQMIEVEKTKNYLNDKISALELKNVSMEILIKEKNKSIEDLKCELSNAKESNKQISNDLKIIDTELKNNPMSNNPSTPNPNQTQENSSSKPNLKVILFYELKRAKSIITFLNIKLAQLEKENSVLSSGTGQLSEITSLKEEINSHIQVLAEKEKTIQKFRADLCQAGVKHYVLSKDIDVISTFIKDNYDDQSNQINPKKTKTDVEKNKAFTLLLFQMRKAIKMINFLTKQ